MKFQKYFTVILCCVFVLFFSFWCFFIPTPDYSESERRKLAEFPEITLETISSGEFAKKFQKYTTDRFPLRETWRSIKAHSRLKLYMQKENNGIFTKKGHISKIEYPLNTDMLDYSISLFNKIQEKYLKENDIYFVIIPDKNKYLADLKIDYDKLENYMYENLSFTPIQIGEFLSIDDYYFTDSHWRQENIADVAKHISESMGATIPKEYKKLTLKIEFKGVYAGQSALKCKPDTISYLTNDIIENLQVSGASAVYDTKKATSKDPYEFFLSGNQPLVKIKNPKNTNGKRLIIFRDSFASSITPLLAQGFSEVVMIDLRYMNSEILNQFVDFADAQVLFMYSANILNNSTSMK